MRMTLMLIAAVCLTASVSIAQDNSGNDNDAFKNDIKALYAGAKTGFKDLMTGDGLPAADGNTRYKTDLVVNGAKEAYVSVDEENSKTYVAIYEFRNLREPEKKLEVLMNLVLEATTEYGLERSKGTEIRYVGYRKHTVEFPSDNIDLMGKYPSFAMGVLDDGNPVIIEFKVTEPLWK